LDNKYFNGKRPAGWTWHERVKNGQAQHVAFMVGYTAAIMAETVVLKKTMMMK
jgi:hypothetical protein